MSVEKKTIQIHPDLFNLSTSKTRKKRNTDENGGSAISKPIKVKATKQETNKTVRNRILKYIREQQDLKKTEFDLPPLSGGEAEAMAVAGGGGNNTEKSQFDESIEFMKSFVEKSNQHNQTIKQRAPFTSSSPTTSVLTTPSIFNKLMEEPNISLNLSSTQQGGNGEEGVFMLKSPVAPQMKMPVYGCMKGGALPTYRSWTNQTQKVGHHPSAQFSNNLASTNTHFREPLENMTMTTIAHAGGKIGGWNKPLNVLNPPTVDSIGGVGVGGGAPPVLAPLRPVQSIASNQLALIKEMNMRNKQIGQQKQALIRKKQKRIIRRTYRVGKSKKFPRVSVLVSNKNIRRNITTKTHEIKQLPIEEVKRALIKRGFIKVGSTAPVDILRKMYESMVLIGGEIENHNPDYLLHNYISSGGEF